MNRSPVRTVSKKRAVLNHKRTKFVKQVLAEVPYCQARLGGCTHRSTDVHEILTRARGGSIIDRANVAALCRNCHGFITVNPLWSQANGFILHSWSTESDAAEAAQKRRGFLLADIPAHQALQGGNESVA